ncbi:hypothetical protein ACFY0F_31005 [Streptomyces sp. NPDC001544]|uniref:hypothetical protein n=1 Tax=Streptomyces sp. NPDC001544 TaxID=3364584 RepID=UPI0036C4ECB1
MAGGNKSSDVPGFSEGQDGVWATKDGDTSGDYSSWDWKHIMAAINGGAAYVADSHNQEQAKQFSDPETVQQAANTFYYTQQVLEEVAQVLKDQTDQLTGENGPWQGEAASTLRTAMAGLSTQVQHMSDTLSGGVTGDYNVPQQLADNAQHLREAKAKINDINAWYAQQALAINPHLLMSNGLVRVSANKKIVEMMGNDMRSVLVALSQHYKVTKDSVSQPTSPTNPANSPSDNMPYTGDGMPYTGDGMPYTGDGMPYTGGGVPNYGDGAPYTGDGMPYNGGGIPNYGGNSPQDVAAPTDYPNTGLTPGTGTLDPTDPGSFSPNATDPGAPGSTAGGPGIKNATVSPAPFDASDLGSGAPLDNGPGLSPNAFTGDTSLGGDPANMPSTGQLDPAMDAALNPNGQGTGAPMPEVAPFPLGAGLTSPGTGNTGAKPRTLDAPAKFPGDLGLDAPGATGQGSPTAPGTADIAGFPDTSLPDVNTDGIAAPGTGVGSVPDVSGFPSAGLSTDAPGLSGGTADVAGFPSTGVGDGVPGLSDMPTDAAGAPGAGVNAFPGSTALDGAGRTPMMPMMPMGGMGGMGGGAGGQEGAPSDASGLLGGDVTPWTGSSDLGGDTPGEVTGGVGAGGPGLHLPGREDLAVPGLPGGSAGSADVAGFPSTGVGDGVPGLSDMPTDAAGLPGDGANAYPGSTAPGGAAGTPMMPMMPMMPMGGMGGMGGGAGGQEGARSDASGLLGGDTGPWAHTADAADPTADVVGGARAGGPGLNLPGDGADHLVAGGPSPQTADGADMADGANSADGAESAGSAAGTPMMPMMPMGGMGAGAAGGEREQQRSDASGLLFTTGEPWAGTPTADGPAVGSPNGASPGDAYLSLGDGVGVGHPAATAAWPPSVAGEPDQEQPYAAQAEQSAAGFPAVLPFLGPGASTGGTGTSSRSRGERGERSEQAEGTPAALWGDAEWPAGQPGAPGAEPSQGLSQSAWDMPQAAAVIQPSTTPVAAAQPPVAADPAGVHPPAEEALPAPGAQLPVHTEVAAPAHQAATAYQTPAAPAGEPQAQGEQATARQEPVHQEHVPHVPAAEAPAADDPTSWDVSAGSLFPLLGGDGQETDTGTGTGTGTEAARQEAAAATSVMAGAYAIARAVTADQALTEPARPAWRPKASGGGIPVELSCAIDEPEEPPAENTRRRSSAVDEDDEDEDAGRRKGKKRDQDGKTSVADLLRQEENVWGGAGQGSSVFG